MNVLIIGAHTDDEHGMSGTIRLLANAGHHIHLIVTTDGLKNGNERRTEMASAAKVLGIESVHYLGEPDGSLYPTPEVHKRFGALVDTIPKPDVVFVMWPVDVHPDHSNTASLALYKFCQRGVNTPMFAYALNSSGRAYSYIRPQTLAFFPTHYVDVGSVVEIMKQADANHVTQDAPVMWNGVEAMLRGRALEATVLSEHMRKGPVVYAEAFVYMTRFGKSPEWLDEFFLRPIWMPQSIPYLVTPESIGLK